MPKYTDLVASGITDVPTAETALTSGSPYTPVVSGTMTNLIGISTGIFATTFSMGGYLRAKCPTFEGVDAIAPLHFASLSTGVAVTPFNAFGPTHALAFFADGIVCNLPIKAGIPITILVKFPTAPTNSKLDVYITIQR